MPAGRVLIDLANQRFGKWLVLERDGTGHHPVRWLCRCDCGRTKSVRGQDLRGGTSKSCRRCMDHKISKFSAHGVDNPWSIHCSKLHGPDALPATHRWVRRAHSIRQRCIAANIEFGFETARECAKYLDSITPERCPVFGMKLELGSKGFSPSSPSADRINPKKGYVRGNLQVISMKANVMKADSSPEELRIFALWALGSVPERNVA